MPKVGSSASSFMPQVWPKDSEEGNCKSIIKIKNYVLRLVLIKRNSHMQCISSWFWNTVKILFQWSISLGCLSQLLLPIGFWENGYEIIVSM